MASVNKKKIIICINNLSTGGSEKQVSYIANFFSEYYSIKLFLLEKKKINYKISKNIEIIQSKYFLSVVFQYILELIKNKFTLIFFFLPKSYLVFGILSLFVNKRKKIMFRRSLNYYQNKNYILKKIEIFLHNFTGHFIANSFAARNELIKFEKIKANITDVVYNFIEPVGFSGQKKIVKSKNFLCTANFYKYKNHKLILETLYYFNKYEKNWKLFLVGNNKDSSKDDLFNIAKKLKISKNVNFVNKLKKEFVFPYIRLGLLFSKSESLPNSIIEYMQKKIPTFAYNTGDIKKISNNCGIIYKTDNPEILAKKIFKIINSNKLQIFSKNTNNKMKLFSKKNTLMKLIKICKKLEN